jgi:hypothetical protein
LAFTIIAGLAILDLQAAPFTATTLDADPVTGNSAQGNGIVNPNGKKARYMFQLRRPGARRFLRATPWTVITKGQTNVAVSGELTGLEPNTTYEYRVVAMRGTVRRVGAITTFTTTPPVPSAVTGSATDVTSTSATLSGTVSPNGSEPAVAYFEYGTTTAYGSVTTTVSVDAADTQVTRAISGLTPGTEYHFRIVASNSVGVTFGEDGSFVTPANPASVVTLPATGVNSTSATLNGTVDPNGSPTTVFFQWGTSAAYGNTTAAVTLPAGDSAVPVSAVLSSLAPNTTYHFRVVATNAGGRVEGANQTFFTQQIMVDCSESALRAAVQSGGTILITCSGTITVASPIVVSRSVTLDGSGVSATISGGGVRRVFSVSNGVSFVVNNITISDGSATSGGAILNEGGSVTLNNVALNNNRASLSGGAIANLSGTLTASNCTFNGNQVNASSTVELASSASGGAVFNGEGATANIRASTFANNSVTAGSAIANTVFVSNGGNAEGGAIYNAGALTLLQTRLQGNAATGGNGAQNTAAAGVNQSGAAGSSGGSAVGGGVAHRGTGLSISEVEFSENTVLGGTGGTGGEGGIGSGGTAPTGGSGGAGGDARGAALFNAGTASVISQSLFANNAGVGGTGGAGGTGGGGINVTGGKGGTGGTGGAAIGAGLFVEGGACNVTNSTFAHNVLIGGTGGTAGSGASCTDQRNPGAGGNGGNGGDSLGVAIYSGLGPVSVVHGTIASNAAFAGAAAPAGPGVSGGGCGRPDSVAGSAGVSGTANGAVFTTGLPTVLVSTIVAYSQVGAQIAGPVALSPQSHNNLFSDMSGDIGSLVANPLLGPLSNNGGFTLTMPLLEGSQAIDNADSDTAFMPPIDQRGVSRPQGAGPDIGAFEKN